MDCHNIETQFLNVVRFQIAVITERGLITILAMYFVYLRNNVIHIYTYGLVLLSHGHIIYRLLALACSSTGMTCERNESHSLHIPRRHDRLVYRPAKMENKKPCVLCLQGIHFHSTPTQFRELICLWVDYDNKRRTNPTHESNYLQINNLQHYIACAQYMFT